jgi:ribosomal protein L16 Arg81 hydroxylase
MCLICRYQESFVPAANAYNIKNTAMKQLSLALQNQSQKQAKFPNNFRTFARTSYELF